MRIPYKRSVPYPDPELDGTQDEDTVQKISLKGGCFSTESFSNFLPIRSLGLATLTVSPWNKSFAFLARIQFFRESDFFLVLCF